MAFPEAGREESLKGWSDAQDDAELLLTGARAEFLSHLQSYKVLEYINTEPAGGLNPRDHEPISVGWERVLRPSLSGRTSGNADLYLISSQGMQKRSKHALIQYRGDAAETDLEPEHFDFTFPVLSSCYPGREDSDAGSAELCLQTEYPVLGMRSGLIEEPRPSVQEDPGSLCSVELPESWCNALLLDASPAQTEDQLNTNRAEGHLVKASEKGAVKKITLIKRAGTRPEHNNTDHMFEIKSTGGEYAPPPMQEDCESGCNVELPESLDTVESPIIADGGPNVDHFFEAEKKGTVRKRTSFRKTVRKPAKINANHFLEGASGSADDPCSVLEDGMPHFSAELPGTLCNAFPRMAQYSAENIDMRTREGRLLKASIKAEVKKITLIKRARKMPEKSILEPALEMNSGAGEEASLVSNESESRDELPASQASAFLDAPTKDAQHSNTDLQEAHFLQMCKREEDDKITLNKKARKRPDKNNLGHTLELKSGNGEEAASEHERPESCCSIDLPESLDNFLGALPEYAEPMIVNTEEANLLKTSAEVEVKKTVKARKRPVKNNLGQSEKQSGAVEDTSSMQEGSEFQCSFERPESVCSTLSLVPEGSADHLNTNTEHAHLLELSKKEEVKKVSFIKRVRKRPERKNLENLLQMKSGIGGDGSSVQEGGESQCSIALPESLCVSFPDAPADAGESLHMNSEEALLFNTGTQGAVKKMTVTKRPRKRQTKINSEHVLEMKTEMEEDAAFSVMENSEPPHNSELPESLCSNTDERLQMITEETKLLKASKKEEVKKIPAIRRARKRPAKGNSDHLFEAESGNAEDASSLKEDSESQCSNELSESLCTTFTDIPADDAEHLHTNSGEAPSVKPSTKAAVKQMTLIKKTRKRPTKNNLDHVLEIKSGTGDDAASIQEEAEPPSTIQLPESLCSSFPDVPPDAAVTLNDNTEEGHLLNAGNKGGAKKITFSKKARKRPAKNSLERVLEIESATGEDASSVQDDSSSQCSAEHPESLCSVFSDVPTDAADLLNANREDGRMFKAVSKRAVKKMTLSQKPRTGLEKNDSDRVLQMKSERVDDGCYSAHGNSVFRYSVELPESLCTEFPAVSSHEARAMDINTEGGRLCLFTANKKGPAKRKPPVKKPKSEPEENISDHMLDLKSDLGEEPSFSGLGNLESRCSSVQSENLPGTFSDLLPDATANGSVNTEEARISKSSEKGSVRKMTLTQKTGTGAENNQPDHVFEMKSGGDDALASVLEDCVSHGSVELPESLGMDFSDVLAHAADSTDLGIEEGSLFQASTKEPVKKKPFIKQGSAGPEDSNSDHGLEMKSGAGEDGVSLLLDDSESRCSIEVAESLGGSFPDVLAHPAEEMDLGAEAGHLGSFQPRKKVAVRKRPAVKREKARPGDNSMPLLKKRGRKRKQEIEVLPNGDVRLKRRTKLGGEVGAKARGRGKRLDSGLSSDGAVAQEGETNLDFGEIFDAVLAEASKWERVKDAEGFARLGLGETITETGRHKAPPLSDNELYSSADEAGDGSLGYSHLYDRNKYGHLRKHREFLQGTQLEKRKTSPYFSRTLTEGESMPRDHQMGAGEDTLSGYEDASDGYMEPILSDTDGESEDLDLGHPSAFHGAGPSRYHLAAPPGDVLPGLQENCKTVEGAILRTEQKQLTVVKNINQQLKRMERHLSNLVKVNRYYIRRSLGLTGELVRENASQSLSLQRIAETLESAIPFPTASGVRLTADAILTSSSSTVSSDSSDEEWAKRPGRPPKKAKRNLQEDGRKVPGKRGRKSKTLVAK